MLNGSDGMPLNPEVDGLRVYFNRAVIALHAASEPELNPEIVGMLISSCLHSCHSCIEMLQRLSSDNPNHIRKLRYVRYRNLIKKMRDLDIHGNPIPTCHPGVSFGSLVSSKHPITLSSSNNMAISVQMRGAQPVVRRQCQSASNITWGDAVSYFSDGSTLYVYDFESKTYPVLYVLRICLSQLESVVKDILANALSVPDQSSNIIENA